MHKIMIGFEYLLSDLIKKKISVNKLQMLLKENNNKN